MGSGHILVYAFDVLMRIYESAGYSKRDAAKSIVENNIYGLVFFAIEKCNKGGADKNLDLI